MTKRPLVTVFAFLALSIFITAYYDSTFMCILSVLVMIISVVRCILLTLKDSDVKTAFTVFLCALAILTGVVNCSLANDYSIKPLEKFCDNEVVANVKVLSRKDVGYSTDRYYVNVMDAETDDNFYQIDEKIRISVPSGETDFDYGDILRIKGTLEHPDTNSNEGLFNNNLYLKTQNVFYTMYVNSDNIERTGRQTDKASDKIRMAKYWFVDKIDESVADKDSRAVLKSIMFGDKSELDEDINEAIRISGVSHILAVSGMHIAFIVMFMTYLFSFFGRKRRNILLLTFGIPLLAIFAFMVGTTSVIRAVVMMGIFMVSEVLYEETDSLTSLSVAGIIVLMINPFSLFDAGFELSFLASAGIILFYKNLDELFLHVIKWKAVRNVMAMTVSAQLLTLPVLVCTFKTLPVLSIVTNILVAWLAPVLFLGGFIIALFASFGSFMATLSGAVITIFATVFIQVTKIIAMIPWATITVGDWNLSAVISCYCAVLILYMFFNERNYKRLVTVELFCGAFFVISILSNLFFINTMEISFLDVGFGDCTYIKCPGGANVLINTGGVRDLDDTYNYGENVVWPYLVNKGVKEIDKVFITDFRENDAYGLDYLMDNFKIGEIYITNDDYINKLEYELLNKAFDKGITVYKLLEDARVWLSKNAYITMVAAVNNADYDDKCFSMILKLQYDKNSVLFAGNINNKEAQRIAGEYGQLIESDVLKISCNDWDRVISESFARTVNSDFAVISTGYKNLDDEILSVFDANNCRVMTSKNCGEIKYVINGNGETDLYINKQGLG